MSWIEAREMAEAVEQLRRQRLIDAASAARVAQADQKTWTKWLDALSS